MYGQFTLGRSQRISVARLDRPKLNRVIQTKEGKNGWLLFMETTGVDSTIPETFLLSPTKHSPNHASQVHTSFLRFDAAPDGN
jgi:hypothetical protein